MIKHYVDAMTRYFDFSGRTSRAGFWFYILAYVLLAFAAGILDAVLFGTSQGILYAVVLLVHLIPGIAIVVRRLHDIGKSGWNYLWLFLPLVGAILMLVWTCTAGQGHNRFGAPPDTGTPAYA
mgnify:CR=1 FL=1|jgi:Predicted membrane protein